MKNAAMIIVSAIMGFLVLGIVLTIGGSMNRRCEAETILPSAMEKTIEGMTLAEEDCSSGELVLAECVELLAAEIDTDSDVVLEIYQNDVQKGVLSMKLEEKFRHPNGMEGTAEAVRTIIREKRKNVSKEQYRVRFYRNRWVPAATRYSSAAPRPSLCRSGCACSGCRPKQPAPALPHPAR